MAVFLEMFKAELQQIQGKGLLLRVCVHLGEKLMQSHGQNLMINRKHGRTSGHSSLIIIIIFFREPRAI